MARSERTAEHTADVVAATMVTAMLGALLLMAQAGRVHFVASAFPDTVYVGQQVSYDGSLRIGALAPPRFVASPEYTPPDVKGVMTYTFPFDTATSIRKITMGGVQYTQYTYHRAVFPLSAGTYAIPPAELAYTLLDEADPYASRPTVRRSAPQMIVVLPLPSESRPADFSGAVGRFTLAAEADSVGLHVGSGFVVRISVTGAGNIPLIRRPALTIPWATVAATSESVALDLTGTSVHGLKEFRWLVTPRAGGRLRIPPVRFSYFDPAAKAYRTATTAAIPLAIAQRRAAGAATIRDEPPPAVSSPLLLALVAVPAIGAVALVVGKRRRAHRPAAEADSPSNLS